MSKGFVFGKYRLGWKKQLPDFRDFKYAAPPHVLKALPPMVDLRMFQSPVYNQTTLGSCTANAIGAGHQFGQVKQLLPPTGTVDASVVALAMAKTFVPSRLFIYWNERFMEGSVNEDAGAIIRDGIKSVASQGVCPETMWGYDVSKFAVKPPEECYKDAMQHQVTSYRAVAQTLDQLKGCLAEGYPFVFGFSVYESFETAEVARTGVMTMPNLSESLLGGHAVIAVGYDDSKQWFVIRNSWGEEWGDKGYFYMPYSYIANQGLASDFWTIRMVENEDGGDHSDPVAPPTPEPPKPEPHWLPCDGSLFFSATQAFVDAAVNHADNKRTSGRGFESAGVNGMLEAGMRGLRAYLQRVEQVRARKS